MHDDGGADKPRERRRKEGIGIIGRRHMFQFAGLPGP